MHIVTTWSSPFFCSVLFESQLFFDKLLVLTCHRYFLPNIQQSGHLMSIEFKDGESPIDGKKKHISCFASDEVLQGLVRVHHGDERLKASSGGRGGGRGRGGRGRGRGGGRGGRGGGRGGKRR